MEKPEEEKPKKPVEKASAPHPSDKRKKQESGDKVEEIFGVHIISDADIENHFGIPESDASDESKNKQ